MPSYGVHQTLEASVFLPLSGGLFVLFEGLGFAVDLPLWVAYAGAYFFSSFFLSPDLDMKGSACRSHWGVLSPLWVPYSKLFKHRKISHNPLFGPLTRVVYLGIWIFVLLLICSGSFQIVEDLFRQDPRWYVMVGLGLYFPNLIHIVADYVS
ncbi:MAG: DUF2227 family putative metal-binding protein [Candidatus Acetothermia bacterium]